MSGPTVGDYNLQRENTLLRHAPYEWKDRAVRRLEVMKRRKARIAELEAELAQSQARLAELGSVGVGTRNYGDGNASALWDRIEEFREDSALTLCDEDVRELAEWWAELHTNYLDADEKLAQAEAKIEDITRIIETMPNASGDDKVRRAALAEAYSWLMGTGLAGPFREVFLHPIVREDG